MADDAQGPPVRRTLSPLMVSRGLGRHLEFVEVGLFVIPVGEPDPSRRMAEIGRRCRAVRREPSLASTDSIAGFLNALPVAAVSSMLKRVDFVASFDELFALSDAA